MNPPKFLEAVGINDCYYSDGPYEKTEDRRRDYKQGDTTRSVTLKELIFEIDIEKDLVNEENKKLANEIQQRNFEKFKTIGFNTCYFSHDSPKSDYVRLYGLNFETKEQQRQCFEIFKQEYLEKLPDGMTYDEGFYGSFHWCPLEQAKHYKYKDKTHKLIDFVNMGKKAKLNKEILEKMSKLPKQPGKAKVKLGYWEILKKPNATEQERVSCIKKLANSHSTFTFEEAFDYVCKNNEWVDFNAEITREKMKGCWNRYITPEKQELKENINKAIISFIDYFDMAKQFLEMQPLYYNEKKFWWAWSHKDKSWNMIDDVDILNSLNQKIHGVKLFESKQKTEILTALQMEARKNKPIDAPDHWVQFKDKIIDYKTGEIMNATPDYFITNPISYEIGETENTPIIDKWFEEWVGKKWKKTLYELIAFSTIPNYKINRIFCLNGEGRNGKSTFLHILRNFLGKRNCCSSSMDTLVSRQFESAKLYKKLLCEMGEINTGIFRKTELIKKLVGADTIGFEFKGKDGFDGYNYAKIVIATNKLPETTDKTTGFYSKWIIIDFPNKFKDNPNFLDDLPEEEYKALSKKCVRIIRELMAKGEFANEGTAEEKELRYEEKSSPFNNFFKLEMKHADMETETPFFLIYNEYSTYCAQRSIRLPSKVELGRILRTKGFQKNVMRYTFKDEDSTVQSYKGLEFKETKNGFPEANETNLGVFEEA